jgi:uroporphyrinogen decarboxylase
MRQAGRYLPQYRKIRDHYDFMTMCKTPSLAAEITLLPIEILGVDAAILFSDILVIPEAMGMGLEFHEGRGPVFPDPIRAEKQIRGLIVPDPAEKLGYVLDAILETKERLGGRVPLISFSGSPWTLAAYMIEGQGSPDFRQAKTLMYDRPDLMHLLLGKLAQSITAYLNSQIEAGADAVQIFDTWGGVLSPDDFQAFSLSYVERIISGLRRNGTPVIFYCRGMGVILAEVAQCGADVIGIDWTVDIGRARETAGERVAVQGNLDPAVLYATPEKIREAVRGVLGKFGRGAGHIFNLGAGVAPDVPVEHVRALVQAVKEESRVYHNGTI